jgi:hypothetical protein
MLQCIVCKVKFAIASQLPFHSDREHNYLKAFDDAPYPQKTINWKKPKAQPKPNFLCIISGAKFSNNIGELRAARP